MPIRSAKEADALGIAALLEELGYPAAAERVLRRLRTLLPRDDYAVLVAEQDQILLGLGCVHVFPALHVDEPVALLTALVVAASARGSGFGRSLVTELESFARSHGCTRILVTTANERADAHMFYEQLGYTCTGRRYAKQPL